MLRQCTECGRSCSFNTGDFKQHRQIWLDLVALRAAIWLDLVALRAATVLMCRLDNALCSSILGLQALGLPARLRDSNIVPGVEAKARDPHGFYWVRVKCRSKLVKARISRGLILRVFLLIVTSPLIGFASCFQAPRSNCPVWRCRII